jgi:hypothetical protein
MVKNPWPVSKSPLDEAEFTTHAMGDPIEEDIVNRTEMSGS